MADKNLPNSYKGYSTQELLKIWDELQMSVFTVVDGGVSILNDGKVRRGAGVS
jgi:hypothetical protein